MVKDYSRDISQRKKKEGANLTQATLVVFDSRKFDFLKIFSTFMSV